MARFGLWVAVLAACLVVTVVNAAPDVPQPDPTVICEGAKRGGDLLNIGQVFDMLFINFRTQLPDFGTEQLKELMAFADGDKDNYLSMDECVNLLNHINKK